MMKTIYAKDYSELRKKALKLGKEWKFVCNDQLADGTWASTYERVKKQKQVKPRKSNGNIIDRILGGGGF